jgi:cell division protein FtsB
METDFYRKKKKRFDLRLLSRKLLKNRRAMLSLAVGLPILLYVIFGSHGLLQRVRLQQEKADLQAKIRNVQAENKSLEAQSKALDSDKKAIEKVAREKYGMVREGETVYKVDKGK